MKRKLGNLMISSVVNSILMVISIACQVSKFARFSVAMKEISENCW